MISTFNNDLLHGDALFSGVSNSDDTILNCPVNSSCYEVNGRKNGIYVIGIGGGTGSGKTTVSQNIVNRFGVRLASIISLDSYYKELSEENLRKAEESEYNFDHPDALELDLACRNIKDLKKGKMVDIPVYDFKTHKRLKNKHCTLYGASVVIIEGLFALHDPKLRNLMDLKLFIETDNDTRLNRKIKRDLYERKRTIESVLKQFIQISKPAHDLYIVPSMKYADIIIPWNETNDVAIDLITQVIRSSINVEKSFRSNFFTSNGLMKCYKGYIHLIPQTNSIISIQSAIRDVKTPHHLFVHHCKRLMRLLIFESISLLNDDCLKDNIFYSKYGSSYLKICFVMLLPGGEAFEEAVRELPFDFGIGKLFIQTNEPAGELELHHVNLPQWINKCQVLLVSETLATGSEVYVAIRILLDHGVMEENIMIVVMIADYQGIQAIINSFPKVKIVSSAFDETSDKNRIVPALGNFTQRFYEL